MPSPRDYRKLIGEAFEEYKDNATGFVEYLHLSVKVGLPEQLLVAAREMLKEEDDPIKAVWLRLLAARLHARKHQNHLIPAELVGIPEDESLPDGVRSCAYNILSRMHMAEAKLDEALECCEKALTLAGGEKDPATLETLSTLGNCHFYMGRYEEAFDYFRMYLKGLMESGRKIPGTLYNNLAVIHTELGNFNEARKAYNKALEVETEDQNPITISFALSNIASFLLSQNEPAEALKYAEDAFVMMKNSEDNMALTMILVGIAEAHMELGKLDTAIMQAERALFFATNTGRKILIAETKLLHATVLAMLGRPEAADQLKEAIDYCDSLSLDRQPEWIERTLYEYARLLDPKAGYELLLRAREVAESRAPMPAVKNILGKINVMIRNSPANPNRPRRKRIVKRKSSRRKPKM
ncbi:MAG: tetratricopeptide repeat protein [Planctomycetota bacterium]|nr:MAG: tetratricopeptide repeat protein [Planctomycetota bacterium]